MTLKCTKFDFRWGSSPDPLLYLRGLLLKGGRGKGTEGKRWERGMERERRGGRKGNEGVHLTHFAFRTLSAVY